MKPVRFEDVVSSTSGAQNVIWEKIGLFACTGIVAGNMMGSGIALLPSNLASIGSVALLAGLSLCLARWRLHMYMPACLQ